MTPTNTVRTLIAGVGAAATLAGGSLLAGDFGKAIIDDKAPIEAWHFCDIFDYNTLYEGEGFVKEVSFHGRYHGQFISQQKEYGATKAGYHEYHHRRFRLGIEIEMQNNLTFYAESNIADGTGNSTGLYDSGSPFFNDFQDFYLEWEPEDDLFVRVGKQKQHFTREDKESSKRIKTVERSAIVNETAGARPWGAVVGFKTGDLSHQVGGWIYGGHSDSPEWVDMSSGAGFSYNLAYKVSDTTKVHFDYVFADNNNGTTSTSSPAANGFGPAYEHSFALGTVINSGPFQLMSDVIYAANRSPGGAFNGGEDTWGFYVVPSYDITENLEAVFRYGYMSQGREQRPQRFGSSTPNGPFSGSRQTVENYHSIYAGLQYFICGEKLKVLGGYEYTTGDLFNSTTDISGGSWQLAFRTYW